jgi:hypothetical protein
MFHFWSTVVVPSNGIVPIKLYVQMHFESSPQSQLQSLVQCRQFGTCYTSTVMPSLWCKYAFIIFPYGMARGASVSVFKPKNYLDFQSWRLCWEDIEACSWLRLWNFSYECVKQYLFKVQVVYAFDVFQWILAAMIEEEVSLFPFESKVFIESCSVGCNCVQPLRLSLFKDTSCLS